MITSFSILRAFKFSRPSILINLYKTHVRPKLEYNSPIWNPCLIKEITCIENVQRKFTKRLLQRNNISFENYQDRLKILNLETLEKRRIKFDLILMYKIHNNLLDVSFQNLFKDSIISTSYNLRGSQHRLHIPKYSGSSVRSQFFSNRILKIWNNLPSEIINSKSLQNFKNKLNKLDLENTTQQLF